VLLAGVAVAATVMIAVDAATAWAWLLIGVAGLLGITRTLPIGGADMPVVISFLNSLSGVAAAAAGFAIESNALVISGALVGASGLILTNIMVTAMNRTLPSVLFGGFGGTTEMAGTRDDGRVARRATPDDVAVTLGYAEEVIVVPGYGLAVAQAQHAMKELADLLDERGVNVQYAIHPVAGRMPGHMNVLLAEADVPYDRLHDLDEINRDFARADVALVVGANDVVNPLAREPNTPVSGMPILDVDRATTVVVVKRSLSPGFAGIDNPLFYEDNTLMLFADAKQGLTDVIASVKQL
jgi:NAD(P) transhydrogenase subunit beta